ncbi:hypothetical protein BS47DRAFT_1338897 [Hydnum rufescens UP504]|uniref:aminodeoxychorismate synthase n=1 Tax=Hydnum rufescens UP504 TaxID=1448309 RepID=A0A9P6B5G8_9AGAM|nr:hypothetical protein BS47DRAFT_1338897 [Hydnum rufescens UP504]
MNILVIDSFDSFTLNLASLLRRTIPDAIVHVIHNNDFTSHQLIPLLQHFDAVAVGPGPGSPNDPGAVGIIPDIWDLPDPYLLPVLGVCLGHQSLCIRFGGRLENLSIVKHGQCSALEHDGQDIFSGLGIAKVVRYHSLHVVIPSPHDAIVPLAWATDVDVERGAKQRILMAARHRTKPFWGVQYHPESICTIGGGEDIIRNFWTLAQQWSAENGRVTLPLPENWRQQINYDDFALTRLACRPPSSPSHTTHPKQPLRVIAQAVTLHSDVSTPLLGEALLALEHERPGLDGHEFLLLDSNAEPGRFSIIGFISPTTARITYTVGDTVVRIRSSSTLIESPLAKDEDIWTWLAHYMGNRSFLDGNDASPFWGGLIGYSTYECGVATLGVDLPSRPKQSKPSPIPSTHPDLSFAFVERSVVVDRVDSLVHIQSIGNDTMTDHCPDHANPPSVEGGVETAWVKRISSFIQLITDPSFTPAPTPQPTTPVPASTQNADSSQTLWPPLEVEPPNKTQYISSVKRTQEYLAQGESYEICLTALTRVTLPRLDSTTSCESTSWRLFKTLRALNPAPYGCFIRLGGTTLVGSSPERFLSWTRDGLCQLRPIKGTIKKSRGAGKPEVTLAEAEDMFLGSPKEIAENLMIVDLIRHDLSRVVCRNGSREEVRVTQLFSVEEYEAVYQLVSVIEGRVDVGRGYTGWDVLARSLPPGSMTGAPKKRSVELLQILENSFVWPQDTFSPRTPCCDETEGGHERGVYSGVCGYWCVGGGGDFSVIIRSAFKYDDECEESGSERWYVGAGGAITALSDAEDEWEEMKIKLSSTLRAFEHL